MHINESREGDWTVLTLVGKIDETGADELKTRLLPLMTGGAVALDFSGTEYITSSGFRVLMIAERDQRGKQGRLLLGNMSEPVRHFFDVAGLSARFKVVHDLGAAMTAK